MIPVSACLIACASVFGQAPFALWQGCWHASGTRQMQPGSQAPGATPLAEPDSDAAAPAGPVATRIDPAVERREPPAGLFTPIPEQGGLPPIYTMLTKATEDELRHRARVRQYAKQVRLIRHKHFGDIRAPALRALGIEQLREFTDPAAFQPLIAELAKERDDVRLALLDHFALQGDQGQIALAWMAVHDRDAAIRNEALRRLQAPATDGVRYVIDGALRSKDHATVIAAAGVAGSLNLLQAIPLLIFAQATANPPAGEGEGDLAWIAIQTQQAYVAGVQPVVGAGAGAFQPIIGTVSDGVVMRVVDAVVIIYRTTVHDVLVNMADGDWGQPTEQFGYDLKAWWDWYNTQYVPFKNEQAMQRSLERQREPAENRK